MSVENKSASEDNSEEPLDRFQRLVGSEDQLSEEELKALLAQGDSSGDQAGVSRSEADAYFTDQESMGSTGPAPDEKISGELRQPENKIISSSDSVEAAEPYSSPESEPAKLPNALPPVNLATQAMPAKDEDTAPLGPRSVTTPHVPYGGNTPPNVKPALDKYGFPLPRRVEETDVNATRVSPAAY
jgi:hypothetical protein